MSKLVNFAGFCSKKFKSKNIHFLAIPPRGKMNTVNFIEILNDEFKSKISYCGENVYYGDLDYSKFKDNLRGGIDERFYSGDLLHLHNFGINHLGNLIRNYLVAFYCGAKTDLTFDLGQARLSSTLIELPEPEEIDTGAKDKGTGREQNLAVRRPNDLASGEMLDQTLPVQPKNFKKVFFKFEKKLVEFKDSKNFLVTLRKFLKNLVDFRTVHKAGAAVVQVETTDEGFKILKNLKNLWPDFTFSDFTVLSRSQFRRQSAKAARERRTQTKSISGKGRDFGPQAIHQPDQRLEMELRKQLEEKDERLKNLLVNEEKIRRENLKIKMENKILTHKIKDVTKMNEIQFSPLEKDLLECEML